MTTQVILEKISSTIHSVDPRAEAWLFGSRARGDNRADSDWDILILVNGEQLDRNLDRNLLDALFDLELELNLEQVIKPMVYTRSQWQGAMSFTPLYKNVLRERIKI